MYFDLRCLIVVEKSVTNKCNRKTVHLQCLACLSIIGSMHSTSNAALEVILMLPPLSMYIEGEARQATYRLNCFEEFTRARFGNSEVFEKMTDEWPSLLVPGDKLVPFIAFGRRFLVALPPRSSWLSQETSEILPSDGVIFYMDGLLGEGRVGAGVFSDTLDIRESYTFGSLVTVFQTEVYPILAYCDYLRSANMHIMTICICSDSKAALLALSLYKISSKLLHQVWLSLQDLSNNNRVRLFWVSDHCDIKGNEEVDRLVRMGSESHFCGPEPCVPLSA
jgi:hypothetical protein